MRRPSCTGAKGGAPKKSALKKEGAAPKPKRKLAFKENLEEPEPIYLSQPRHMSDIASNDLEQANFREVWREVSSKKLDNAARILQTFARKCMLCWIIVNDRRTELLEELDAVEDRLKGDLERVEWEREDMVQDADFEVQAELDNAPPEERNLVKERLAEIRSLQSQIRTIKQETHKIKDESKCLKKANTQLKYDLKERVTPVEMSKYKVETLECNQSKIRRNHDQYMPNLQKWQDALDAVNSQFNECRRQGRLYRDCVLKIVPEVQERCTKKKVVDRVMEHLKEYFIQYHPLSAVGGENDDTDSGSDNGEAAHEPEKHINKSLTTKKKSSSKSHKKDKKKHKEHKKKVRKAKTDSDIRPTDKNTMSSSLKDNSAGGGHAAEEPSESTTMTEDHSEIHVVERQAAAAVVEKQEPSAEAPEIG